MGKQIHRLHKHHSFPNAAADDAAAAAFAAERPMHLVHVYRWVSVRSFVRSFPAATLSETFRSGGTGRKALR